MMSEATPLLVPAPSVPMATKIRGIFRDDDEMSYADFDDAVTPGTGITLVCLIRLNGVHMVVIEVPEHASAIDREAVG
ncbi:MAG: hypothetical protein BMS9Abin12_1676 [Acidimicrobiia bacterium]|nr:MAG: hypothetical protein BMS9Abin12_1676 [Acidimicrobiia bacterium]